MSTNSSIGSKSRLDQEKYDIILSPNPDGSIGLKVTHMVYAERENENGERVLYPIQMQWLEPTEEALARALQQNALSYSLCDDLDPYFRWKLKDSKLYDFFYNSNSTHKSLYEAYGGRLDREGIKKWIFLLNMIRLSTKELSYLHNLVKPTANAKNEDYFDYFIGKYIIRSNGKNRNSRIRLGFSKKKETIIKKYGYTFLVGAANQLFDDDLDFLCEILDQLSCDEHRQDALYKILGIKKMNPNLKYEDIIRRAAKHCLENKTTYLRISISNLYDQSLMYGKLVRDGLDQNKHPMMLSNKMLACEDSPYRGPEGEVPFAINGWDIVPIKSMSVLNYVNLLANAAPKYYLTQTTNEHSDYYAGFRKKKVVLIECKDGFVQNIRRNFRDVLLTVEYKEIATEGKDE